MRLKGRMVFKNYNEENTNKMGNCTGDLCSVACLFLNLF